MVISGAELDDLIERRVSNYLAHNRAAGVLRDALDEAGVGFVPVMDHLTFRTLNIDKCASLYERLGYTYSETLEYNDWYAKIYRAPGYPALFIDQAYDDERGNTSLIPEWVRQFGDDTLHHVAVRVEDIEKAIGKLEAKGVRFSGEIVGRRGENLRQIFTSPELVGDQPFSVLELIERHEGYLGFSPPQADSLMQSTLRK